MRIRVRIIPGAKQNQLVEHKDGVYKIRLTAPPIDGRANEALLRFLADRVSLAPSCLSIVSGHTNKQKMIEIPLSSEEIQKRLPIDQE